ncbi:uncharacterized protein LOC119436331 isoform X2 [Dermacentor silvarum]|uniref:uncharacterized protein LOC119436331 isoform X2 n=1 Tax=Dermacentor silvarum TaxID=543639 RepID=UPI0021016747|nr:uncharacterized protein LOC119436331 isoform X2 [Dermacentor silvarum]
MFTDARIPLPVEPLPNETDDKRIWVGNLDSRLTEFQLIKVLKKYGNVKKFDFLFHKAGPLKGHPRGYCFVTYETKEQAERALSCLHGKLVFSKTLVAKWANNVPSVDLATRRQGLSLGVAKKEQKPVLKRCLVSEKRRNKERRVATPPRRPGSNVARESDSAACPGLVAHGAIYVFVGHAIAPGQLHQV